MLSVTCLTTRRLFVPLIRSQVIITGDVKYSTRFLQSTRSSLLVSRGGNSGSYVYKSLHNSSKPTQPSRVSFRAALLSLPSRSFGIKLPGANTASNLIFRGGAQQLRSYKLPLRGGDNEWEALSKLSIAQRLKILLKKYWYIAIPLHMAFSVVWLGSFYLTSVVLAKCGVDSIKLVLYVKPYVQQSRIVPQFIKNLFDKDPASLGHFTVALLFYKFATPLRYLSTIFGTFYMVRFLLRAGVLVRSSNELSASLKHSYLNHAIHQNIQKRVKTLKYRFKKPPRP